MFRVLVVEDDLNTLSQLEKLLSSELTESKIETASTVDEALHRLDHIEGWAYDAFVLDLRLPKSEGEDVEPDVSICQTVSERMPDAVVAHVTAFMDDAKVREHLKVVHLGRIRDNAFALSKLDDDWPKGLVRQLKAHLYGIGIAREMDSLFGAPTADASELRPPRGRSGIVERGGTTQRLAALCRDIVEHWDDIDDRLKRRIRQAFAVVDETSRPIRISLM